MRVGFIGLGIMGESMCENIVKKTDSKVLVYDISIEKVEKLVAIGAAGAASVKEVGESCDRIVTMVPKSEHVQAVIEELIPFIKPGTIIIEMSTIDPAVSRELAKALKERGCQMVDAPVVKSKTAAIAGELGIYVGGTSEVYEIVKPILECMGNNIIHMGDNGSGLVMKICHNMLVAQIQNGVNEMLTLAEASGLDFDDTVKAISYGGGQNFYLDGKKETIKAEDFSPKFSIENMHKDIYLALKLGKELELNLQGADTAREIYDAAMEEGLKGEDFSASIKVVKKIRKV